MVFIAIFERIGAVMQQAWVEVSVGVTPEAEEAVSNLFWELGSNGVIHREHKPSGTVEAIVGFLPEDAELDDKIDRVRALWNELAELGLVSGECRIETGAVPVDDWTTSWQKRFEPIRVSDRLIIAPPWDVPVDADAQVVVIEPGMAFGTGEHETTQLCLRMLENEVQADDRILDIGSGSGILSIAAVFLGARSAVAVDIDEETIENARDNIQRNGVADRVQAYAGQVDHPKVAGPYRLIVSNIDAQTLTSLLSSFSALLAVDGVLLLSGILISEAPALETNLDRHGFLIKEQFTQGEWWGGMVKGR